MSERDQRIAELEAEVAAAEERARNLALAVVGRFDAFGGSGPDVDLAKQILAGNVEWMDQLVFAEERARAAEEKVAAMRALNPRVDAADFDQLRSVAEGIEHSRKLMDDALARINREPTRSELLAENERLRLVVGAVSHAVESWPSDSEISAVRDTIQASGDDTLRGRIRAALAAKEPPR